MRTVGGVSQIAGAATMTLRNMLRSIDSYTQSVISALVEWNYEFKPSKDILGDSTVVIDKSMSLVAKEIRALRLIDTLQYLPQDIRMTHVEGAELARLVFETQDISTKGLLKTAEQVAESQKSQAEAAQAALELEKARANKLNASAEAQRASIEHAPRSSRPTPCWRRTSSRPTRPSPHASRKCQPCPRRTTVLSRRLA